MDNNISNHSRRTSRTRRLSTIVNNGSIRKIAVVSPERPRAIVIIFGWTGADPQTLRSYEEFYHENSLATVSTAPPIIYNTVTLSRLALNAAGEAVRLIRRNEPRSQSIPVFTHVFSNGGALLLEQLERKLLRATASNMNATNIVDSIPTENNDLDNISLAEMLATSITSRFTSSKYMSTSTNNDSGNKTHQNVDTLQLKPKWWQIKKRRENIKSQNIKAAASENIALKNLVFLSKRLKIGAQIFDSSPCFRVKFTAIQAVVSDASQAVLHRYGSFIRNISQSRLNSSSTSTTSDAASYICDISTCSTANNTLKMKSSRNNWRHFEENTIATRQFFIYSAADKYTDASKLEELILKKQDLGIQVYVLKLHDSPHIQHFVRYRQEYEIFLSSAIDAICGDMKEEEWIDINNSKNTILSASSVEDNMDFMDEDSVSGFLIQKMQRMSSNYDL